MLCSFIMMEDEIYYDEATQEIVMKGSLGEDRIQLNHRLQGIEKSEQDLVIIANFIYCIQQYCNMQLAPLSTPNMEIDEVHIDFEYDPDSKLVENKDTSINGNIGPKKKEEMN